MRAACCDLVKIDAETASAQVRACDPDATGACASWLFEGTLALGERAEVCTGGDVVVYQEFDATTQAYAAPVEARCNAETDVEL